VGGVNNLAHQTADLTKIKWVCCTHMHTDSTGDVVLDAPRRFVELHRTELMEGFIREDVEWGLHGDE
jgi:ribonuclease BN (tRNA processing enzyme)